MQLYNSLTKKIEPFNKPTSEVVSIYSCGPTVYNNLHIGNLSAFVYADVLRRAFVAQGYQVKHVMNITDIDDKTIRDSKRDYPDDEPMVALKKLTDKYTKVFLDDMKKIGNDMDAIQLISAVDSIPDMIALIQKLLDAKVAYQADDGIYFSIKAYTSQGHDYGVLQHIELAHSQSRVANDEYDKDNASDFALWKAAETGEPSWEATFDFVGEHVSMPGRPGWHIECSAMSEKALGLPFDIHTGGIDLKFPHHENEIAQSIGAGAEKFATFFVHNAHILVDGRKMSKSLGNFYTLRDVEEKGYTAEAFRLLVLSSKYDTEGSFTWDILEAAQNRLRHWYSVADLQFQPKEQAADINFEQATDRLSKNLSDDLNTVQTMTDIDGLFQFVEGQQGISQHQLKDFKNYLTQIQSSIGITMMRENITDTQKDLLSERAEARKNKDWQKSDDIRDQLKEQGIGINDSDNGQIWYRIG